MINGGDHNEANAYKSYIAERLEEGTKAKERLDLAQAKLTEMTTKQERNEGKEDNDLEELR